MFCVDAVLTCIYLMRRSTMDEWQWYVPRASPLCWSQANIRRVRRTNKHRYPEPSHRC